MMTRSTDNVPSSSVSPAYIVFKDPAISLNDGKSVFAGHGAILIGIESMAFFEHLKELLEHEEPELARDICALPTTGFSPAMKVRLKGEANASQLVASFLGCEEYGARDAGNCVSLGRQPKQRIFDQFQRPACEALLPRQ